MRERGLFHQRFGDLFPKERDLREFPLVVVQVVLGQDAAGVVICHGPDSHALEKPVDAGQDLLALPRVLAGAQGDADPRLPMESAACGWCAGLYGVQRSMNALSWPVIPPQ